MVSSSSAVKLLSVLGRVVKDATLHDCSAVVVVDEGSGVRFQSEAGASLAFLPGNQVPWGDTLAFFTKLRDEAANTCSARRPGRGSRTCWRSFASASSAKAA
jgi:hypothetical protein